MLHNSICIKLVHIPCERGRFSNTISQWANMSSMAHPPPETVVSGSSCSSSSLQHKQQQLLSTSEWFQNVLNFFKHRTELHYGVLRNCANTTNIAKFKLQRSQTQEAKAIGHTSLAVVHLLSLEMFRFYLNPHKLFCKALIPYIPKQK